MSTSSALLPWCRSSTLLCRRLWNRCQTRSSSSPRSYLTLSRLSKCPRSCSRTSLCALACARRSWRNSWWRCRRSYPFLPCSGLWRRTSTFPVPGRGGRNAGLQGLPPEQSSTATLFSEARISERIVEQIVDFPISRGSPQGFRPGQSSSSSSHFPVGVPEDADEPGDGGFRTFPGSKKVRSWVRTRVRGCPPVLAHPRRLFSTEFVELVTAGLLVVSSSCLGPEVAAFGGFRVPSRGRGTSPHVSP